MNPPLFFPTSTTRLTGRWLLTARAAWIVTTALSIGVFIAGLIMSGGLTNAIDPGAIRQAGLSESFVVAFRLIRVSLFALVHVLVGVLIFWRRSDDWMALITALMLITFGVTAFSVPSTQPLLYALYAYLVGLAIILNGYFFYTFPDGRFVSRWIVVLLVMWSVFNIGPLFPSTLGIFQPLLDRAGGLLVFVFLASFVAVQAYRYRRTSDATQRQQTKWVVLGIMVALSGYLVFRLAPWPSENASVYKDLIYVSFGMFFMLAIPVSIGVAILRFRLWDIDLIINRALVYGALTASTLGLYVAAVGYFSTLFQTGFNLIIALIATGLTAVLFEPLRERLQRAVNRLMYGERDEPAAVLARLSRRLDSALAPEAALPTIVETVAQALRLPYVAITLQPQDAEARVAAEVGQPQPDLLSLPLTYQSEPVGQLLLAPRARGESFSTADQHLLAIIAQQAGLTAHALLLTDELRQLNVDLQHSRERLVTAQEEERRRMRRDLHDGVGPTLASLSQRLDAAADLVTRDPQASVVLLGELKGQVRGTVAEIRRLVYALRPPVLDEFGLVSAIREHVAPYSGPSGLRVAICAPEPLPPLPAAVEVAVYRIVLEAFTNVVRHAQASACHISLDLNDGALSLEVTDDGAGLPGGLRSGVGLTSMRERAAELGGSLMVESLPARGARVRATLPLGVTGK